MAGRFASSDEIFEYLMRFVNVEKGQATVFKLERMRWLCERLGSPEAACPSIHVAGSKGKGSVAAMMARILQASGFKTGLYTSPHILRWKERVSLAGDELDEDILLAAMDEVLPLVDGKIASDFPGEELPTYFELTTLVAFCAFRLAGCDRTVIETGLGGRLDSTNVVPSSASVITPVELEHTEWLGDSVSAIAFEKAGIVKPGRPCYMSRQTEEAREVFRSACADRGSPLREASELVDIEGVEVSGSGTAARLTFRGGSPLAGRFPPGYAVRCPLVGAVQAENMALALLAAAEVEPTIGPETASLGLARATLPARFQVLGLDPPVAIDGAHTPTSIRLALDSFERLFPGPKCLVFACAYDKKHRDMAAILAPRFQRVTVTKPGTFKQSDPRAAFEAFAELRPEARLVEDTEAALLGARAEAASLGWPLLVTGSFYLCAEALRVIKE